MNKIAKNTKLTDTSTNSMVDLSRSKRSFVAGITLLVCFFVTFFPVWKRLVQAWYSSDDYSHGFFIIPLSIYIIYQKRQILAEVPKTQSNWGLVCIFMAIFIYLGAQFAEIVTVSSFSMILFLAGAIIYFYGFVMFRELLFSLAILLFMIPVPAQIYASLTVPLQLFVSTVSTLIASIMGVPIYREGNVINLPEHTLQVVQACSGLRSMISLLALSALFGYFTLKSNILRTILFLSGIPAAIAVNIFRVVVMVLAFYYFNYDLAQGSVHTIFGIVIFILALILIVMIKGVLSFWEGSAIAK